MTTTAAEPQVGRGRRLVGLDGLRAICALLLFGFHADLAGFHAGWLGVDAFFVLSGFLITTLLIREHRKDDRIDVIRFIKSRTLRLFPVLLLALAVGAVAYAVFPPNIPGERPFLRSAITSLTYTQNLFAGRHPQVQDPLVHTWSLAQEEQFYVLWPFLLGVVLPTSRKVSVSAVLGLAAVSALLLLILTHGPTPSTYFWPWTRSSGLAFGAAIALALSTESTRLRVTGLLNRRGVGAVCLALFVAPFVVLPHLRLGAAGVLFVGVTSVTLTSGLLVAHLAVARESMSNSIFRVQPLIHLGRWSYAFYLVQFPLLIALSAHFGHWSALGLAFAVSLATAALLHYAVEKPLDRLRHRLFAD